MTPGGGIFTNVMTQITELHQLKQLQRAESRYCKLNYSANTIQYWNFCEFLIVFSHLWGNFLFSVAYKSGNFFAMHTVKYHNVVNGLKQNYWYFQGIQTVLWISMYCTPQNFNQRYYLTMPMWFLQSWWWLTDCLTSRR